MRKAIVCVIGCAVAAVLAGLVSFSLSGVSVEPVLAQEQSEPSEMSLMRQKLNRAQRLLEALSIGDFMRITSNAEDLQRISLEARWTMPHSPEYASYGEEFRAALERVVRSSENENIDGAALGYVQVILTCVQCHKVVREGQEFARLEGAEVEGLLERQIAGLAIGDRASSD